MQNGSLQSVIRWIFLCCLTLLVVGVVSCGGGSGAGGATSGTQPLNGNPSIPATNNVVLLVLENASYEDVIGAGTMPYLESLASQGGLATQFFANTHPSVGDYFMMTTGQLVANDDSYAGPMTGDNLARQFIADGKSWKVYAESLPSQGYLGGGHYPYFKHHNPFAFFSDVINDPAQAANIVPFPALGSDAQAGNLPNFSLVLPDAHDNAHDCPNAPPPGDASRCTIAQRLQHADGWLQSNLPVLLNSQQFQSNGLLIITFDEGHGTDDRGGGGRVVTVLVGPQVKKGFQSMTNYQHQDILRTIAEALRLSAVPGAGGQATGMAEFFQGANQ